MGLVEHVPGRGRAALLPAGRSAPRRGGTRRPSGRPGCRPTSSRMSRGGVHMVQQGGGLGVADAVVFVHGLGASGPASSWGQLGGPWPVRGRRGACRGPFLMAARRAPAVSSQLPNNNLAGRGEVDLLQRGVPPLAHQVEGGDGVDLLIPEFQPGRGGHVGGRKCLRCRPRTLNWPGPLHLAAADVPCREQLPDQRVPGKLHPRFEGQGVGHELGPGDGVLQQGFHPGRRRLSAARPPASAPQHPTGGGIRIRGWRPSTGRSMKSRGGKDVGRHPQRFEVVGKVGGLGLAGGSRCRGGRPRSRASRA